MEIPENIANEYCKKQIVLDLGQFVGIVRESVKSVFDELNIKYHDGWTFDKIIKDALIRVTQEKHLINEMALDRQSYCQIAINLMSQIIENWCLCYYCVMMDTKNNNFAHWKTELKSHLSRLKSISIKKGGGDRKKALAKTWINDYDLNDAAKIALIINGKFWEERLDDKSIVSFVSQAFSHNVFELIELLTDDSKNINQYIANKFPEIN